MVQEISGKNGRKIHKAERRKNLMLENNFKWVYNCRKRRRMTVFVRFA